MSQRPTRHPLRLTTLSQIAVGIALTGLAVATLVSPTGSAQAADPAVHWTAATPDEVVQLNMGAALRDDDNALAHLALMYLMHDEASAAATRRAFEKIGASHTAIADDARWLALQLLPESVHVFTTASAVRREVSASEGPTGLIREWVVLGPYQDNGGGLDRKQGPDTPGHRFVGADDSWGAYRVTPRRSAVDMVDARGLALDSYIHPRRESCSYLSTAVTLPAQPVHMHLASSGAYRLSWDRQLLAQDDAVFSRALVDRVTVVLSAQPGQHLVTIKVCSGSRADDGRVRLRFSDEQGADVAVEASSELATLDGISARLEAAPAAAKNKLNPTSLQRALHLAPSPSPQHTLAAAMVRSTFGADDLRSERAPGLLDSALKSSPSADVLAVAGYVSTFGANRSARLMQAIERARQSKDGGALAFAQRRLLLMRIHNRQSDLAHSMLDQPPLRDADDGHARWLKVAALATLGGSGLRVKAAERYHALADALGEKTPLVVWDGLLEVGSSAPQRHTLRAHQALAALQPGARRVNYVQAYEAAGPAATIKAAKEAVLHQRSVSGLGYLAEVLRRAGDYPAAREVMRFTAEISPNRARVFQELADLEVLIDSKAGNAAAVVALERASELDPDDARLKAKLAFRKGEKADGPRAAEDAQHLVSPDIFLARAKERPAPAKGVHSRMLHWRRVVRFHPDSRVSQLIHYAREIIVAPRTEMERYESQPGSLRGELLRARVHKRDGSVLAPEEKQDDGGMVRWPKLERGDVVEVAIRNFTPGPVGRRGDPPFYFIDYVGNTATEPVLYNEVVFDAPASAPLTWDVLGGSADEVKTRQQDGRTITQLIWNNPPTIADEPFAPRASELLPVVVGSVYPSWDHFLGWYRGAIEGFTEPDDQIRRLAEELTSDKPSREQKLEALFNYVADDIRYVNYRSGEWWLPNRPQQLLARRQGDCDDKAMLLISLLKAVNIDAKEVLVQTRLTAQRRVMQSRKAAIPMFDHGIIYLPNENGEGGRFLDATSPQSRVAALPAMDAGAMVLVVEENNSRIVEIPEARASDHGVTARWTLKLTRNGAGTLHASETHVGDHAFRLRTNIRQPDARAQWVEQNLIGGWLSALEVEKEVRFDGESDGGRAEVEYRAKSGSLARREGADLIVTVAPPVSLTAVLAPLTKRTLPVQLPHWLAPAHRNIIVTVMAPDGYRFAALPPDANLSGAFGSTSVRFSLSDDNRQATMERNLAFSQARIEVAEYRAWRSFLQGADALSQRGLRLTPDDPPADDGRAKQ